ncbi:hypothetical protein DB31_8319 [Hyalangium minutum]|uniref:Uncharacterized protein n=1 Tax=Hyalangium minutum TaxID=394096 RepID=A0A085WH03_9BACT|nr:hypothetical protein DB31_8319 [Hyalangium minutum]
MVTPHDLRQLPHGARGIHEEVDVGRRTSCLRGRVTCSATQHQTETETRGEGTPDGHEGFSLGRYSGVSEEPSAPRVATPLQRRGPSPTSHQPPEKTQPRHSQEQASLKGAPRNGCTSQSLLLPAAFSSSAGSRS